MNKLKNKSNVLSFIINKLNISYENYIYEIIINSLYITCLRIYLSKDQKPYPLNSK